MRFVEIDEKQKNVPVFKNVIYALKLTWKADKKLLLGYIFQEGFFAIFSKYLQNILFLKILLDVVSQNRDFKTYVKELVAFALISLFVKIFQWWGMKTEQIATKKVLKYLNNMVFEKAISLDVSCYEDPAFYDKYQRATLVLTDSYFDLICYDFASFIADVITLVCVIVTVAIINPVYILFLIPIFLVFFIELAKSKCVYKRDMEMTTNNRIKAYVQRTVFLRDFSKDIRTSNIFAVIMKRFEASIKANIEILKNYGFKLFLYSMASSLFSEFIPIIGTLSYAGYEFVKLGTMSASNFSVVMSSITSVSIATIDTTECFDEMTLMALYFQNLREFFEYEPKIISGKRKAEKFESLEFKNVSFKYPSAQKYSLENVSFKLTKGQRLAIVGVNGAGKSTLVKLILRFYDATRGQILYNGIDIKEYDLSSLRNSFATVFQDYKNFAISVYENVMCHECDENDKKIAEKALRQSGAWSKVSTLKYGGDTSLTREFDENGAGLSGGESQKVSTARLFAKDFEIAVLDEPSSALDPIAEYKMYENLIDVTKGKTVIFISHRLSSAVLSDNIIVLSNGKIIEQGSHNELMKQSGEYEKMFTLQASNYEKEDEIDEN